MRCLNHKGLAVVGILFFFLAAVAAPAAAQDPLADVSGTSMALDLVFVRPIALAATAIGTVFFVASLPFTVWSGERLAKAGTLLVAEPAAFTFVRPLGEF